MYMKKSAGLFNEGITKHLNTFCSQSELKLLGSNSIRGILYPNDIDSVCIVNNLDADELAKHIQNAVKNLGESFIVEFKITIGSKKYRWSQAELLKGKKNGMTLSEALSKADGIVKCDLIIVLDGEFIDATINYQITLDGISNLKPTTKKEKITELKGEIDEYKKVNLFKALKRRFSILNLQGKPTDHILPFFNSEVGLLSQVRGELELLIELHKRVSFVKLKDFIQKIKHKLGLTLIDKDVLFEMNDWTTTTLVKKATHLIRIILEQMNKDTATFLKLHKIRL